MFLKDKVCPQNQYPNIYSRFNSDSKIIQSCGSPLARIDTIPELHTERGTYTEGPVNILADVLGDAGHHGPFSSSQSQHSPVSPA